MFSEPPTKDSIFSARQSLQSTRRLIADISSQIDNAESTLSQLLNDSRKQINLLRSQRAQLETQHLQTLAYLSPIRKLPSELLRDIFLWYFQHDPKCAWTLAAVCATWRRLALQTPRLWSKIRLRTTQHSSADTIRLWLERSGLSVPLDIEIFLRVAREKNQDSSSSRRRRYRSVSPSSGPPSWTVPLGGNHNHHGYVLAPPPVHLSPPLPAIPLIPVAPSPITVPQTPIVPFSPSPTLSENWSSLTTRPIADSNNNNNTNNNLRTSAHWGHVAVFYLVEQMHRWERFVFRFDKQFASMKALKSINGDAPLLREFEISSLEPTYYADWPWLPNGPNTTTSSAFPSSPVPALKSLTLHYTPFKWSSPMFHSNLTSLHLRALPTAHLPLDRILYVVSNNRNLRSLTLQFQGTLSAVLPLSIVTLPHLTSLEIGGHYLLTQILDSLVIPSLNVLNIDIEARDSIEESIVSLVVRSGCSNLLEHLSIAYGTTTFASTFIFPSSSSPTSLPPGIPPPPSSASYYFPPGGIVVAWPALLAELPRLKTLCVGGTPLDPLLTALGPPGEDMHQSENWACVDLERLSMRNCHAHSEGVVKLVQMVEVRNPANSGSNPTTGGASSAASSSALLAGSAAAIASGGSAGGGGSSMPDRLKTLELYECASLGQDVVRWLRDRIEVVACTDLPYDRASGYY
ncbi:hypothetical protein M378DRAFT_13520 [Amanita muscaria Koide BX008]|uniref:Uncharacterized protein n=1 Tax=Amanita muscaria (strain Koide BX008) TaxID=946122 RepID=A0A0C2WXC9_AMAMK|nr:hypothetical protein M378DRAFT_13520 [Amanita muscaria Koide BX008]